MYFTVLLVWLVNLPRKPMVNKAFIFPAGIRYALTRHHCCLCLTIKWALYNPLRWLPRFLRKIRWIFGAEFVRHIYRDEKDMHQLQLGIMKQSPIVGSRKVLFKRKGYSLSVFVTEVVLGTYQSRGRFFCKRTDDYSPVAMTGERIAANSCHAGNRHRSSADCTGWGDHCNNTTPLCLERQFNPPMPSPPKKKGLI